MAIIMTPLPPYIDGVFTAGVSALPPPRGDLWVLPTGLSRAWALEINPSPMARAPKSTGISRA